MSDRYAACGKEVLRAGEHFADCADAAQAPRLAALLNLAEEAANGPAAVPFGLELANSLAELGDEL